MQGRARDHGEAGPAAHRVAARTWTGASSDSTECSRACDRPRSAVETARGCSPNASPIRIPSELSAITWRRDDGDGGARGVAQRQRRGQIYVALAAVAWSTAGVLQRQLTLDTPTQVFGRAVFAGVALLAYVAVVERGRVRAGVPVGRARGRRRGAVRRDRVGQLHRRAQPHERRARPVHPGRLAGARRAARPGDARRADHAAHRRGDGAGAGRRHGDARGPGRGQPGGRRPRVPRGARVRA